MACDFVRPVESPEWHQTPFENGMSRTPCDIVLQSLDSPDWHVMSLDQCELVQNGM